MNGTGSYVLSQNRQTVILLPNNEALDWRVVAEYAPGMSLLPAPKFAATAGRGNRTLNWDGALTRQHTLIYRARQQTELFIHEATRSFTKLNWLIFFVFLRVASWRKKFNL